MKKLIVIMLASLMFLSGKSEPQPVPIVESEQPQIETTEQIEYVEVKAYPEREKNPARQPQLVELNLIEYTEEDLYYKWLGHMSDYDAECIDALAHMAQGEYRLIETPEQKMQCAAVIECAMWRVLAGAEKGFNSTPKGVCEQPYQFLGYDVNNTPSADLWLFTASVYARAYKVLNGADAKECGCVLPTDYLWFYGDGKVNHFRNRYQGGTEWDWSWGNPYGR